MRKPQFDIKLQSYEESLGINNSKDIVEIPIKDLYPYEGHTFKVIDEELDDLLSAIEREGVKQPIIVRNRALGGYEIISGHRRKRACELLKIEKIPVLIYELTDYEADILMVDSNIYRKKWKLSEKAKSYKKKFDALKHQGKIGGNTLEDLGKLFGESSKTVQRIISLADLTDDLLDFVDSKVIGKRQGVAFSYLSEKEQGWIKEIIDIQGVKPTEKQADEIKALSAKQELDYDTCVDILTSEDSVPKDYVIPYARISEYINEDMSKNDVVELFIEFLKAQKESAV